MRPIKALAFAPDGKTLATASQDGTARIWALGGIRASQHSSIPHGGDAHAVSYSSDGKTLATAGPDKVIWLWDLTAAKPTVKTSLTGPDKGSRLVQFSTDGQSLITIADDSRVFDWNLGTGQIRLEWKLPAATVSRVALTADGRYLARGLADGTIEIYRVAEKR
jgi:WD40 repeat protein